MNDDGLVCIISCLHRISATNTSETFQLSEHKGLSGCRRSAQHPAASVWQPLLQVPASDVILLPTADMTTTESPPQEGTLDVLGELLEIRKIMKFTASLQPLFLGSL